VELERSLDFDKMWIGKAGDAFVVDRLGARSGTAICSRTIIMAAIPAQRIPLTRLSEVPLAN
jgi:hypothetical protein